MRSRKTNEILESFSKKFYSETDTLLIAGAPNKRPIELGMGFNWFDLFGVGGYYARWENYPLNEPLYPDLNDTLAWNEIERGLDELGLDWIRFGFPPNAHVDNDGNFIRDTVHIQRLKWLDKWASKNGKTILVDPFMMPFYYEFPLPGKIEEPSDWLINMAARDNKAYAEKFVGPLFETIVLTHKMQSVRYFNPINEPMEYGVYQTPNNDPPAIVHYVEMYKEIRRVLDELGIDRKRVGLVGIDGSFPTKILLDQLTFGVDIDEYLDAYSVHHYDLKLDYLPTKKFPEKPAGYFNNGIRGTIEQKDAELMEYCESRNKPLWALEMGTFYYGKFESPEGVATVDATLTVSEAIIRAVNLGVPTFCIWSLMNTNNVDGHWAVIGLKDRQLVKYESTFTFYSVVCNHISSGATVFPLIDPTDPEIAHTHGTALESDLERTLLLVNDHPDEAKTIKIKLPEHWPAEMEFTLSIADRSGLHSPITKTFSSSNKIIIELPAFTLIGLKEKLNGN